MSARRAVPEAAIEARRRNAQQKRQAVRDVLKDAIQSETELSKATVASRAKVSRDLVDAMRDEFDDAMDEVRRRLAKGRASAAVATLGQVRAELLVYQEQVKQLRTKNEMLRRRLGEFRGAEIIGELPVTQQRVLTADELLQARIDELTNENGQLRENLRQMQEQLDAAQTNNKRLMLALNAQKRKTPIE